MTDSELLNRLIGKFGIERAATFAEIEAHKYELLSSEDGSITSGHVENYIYWKGIHQHLLSQINKTTKGY